MWKRDLLRKRVAEDNNTELDVLASAAERLSDNRIKEFRFCDEQLVGELSTCA